MFTLVVPDFDPNEPEPYPGNIQPGAYTREEVADLLREHKNNPDAIQFIADMM